MLENVLITNVKIQSRGKMTWSISTGSIIARKLCAIKSLIATEAFIPLEFYGQNIIASCNLVFRTSRNNFNERKDARPQIPEFKLIFLVSENTFLLMRTTFFPPHFEF